MTEKKPTRKGSTPIVVRVTPDEKAIIESYAQQTGQSTSAYLRLLGQGYVPKSIMDYGKVMELARINGDLGRLGGLLKLWLTNVSERLSLARARCGRYWRVLKTPRAPCLRS